MHNIQLNDETFGKAQRIALAKGYGSVEEFILEVIENECSLGNEDFDQLFTPELLDELDRRSSELDAGKSTSIEEVEARFAVKRQQWLSERAS